MSIKIDQAFIQAYIDNNFDIATAYENENYTPTAGTPYIELININNDITPLSVTDSNETDGIFRLILRWPLLQGAIAPKIKANEIITAFKIGTKVCYAGDCATVTNTSIDRGYAEDGWYKLILTIGYYAILGR